MLGYANSAVALARVHDHALEEADFLGRGAPLVTHEQLMDVIERRPRQLRCSKETVLTLRPEVQERAYQTECVDAVLRADTGGMIVAPCASGKTFMGLHIAAKRGGNCVILTTRYAEQWVDAVANFFRVAEGSRVLHLTSDSSFGMREVCDWPNVVIASYTIFTARKRSMLLRSLAHRRVSTLILDEGHSAAAPASLEAVARMNFERCYVLTATPVREDDQLQRLSAQVGPTLHNIRRATLEDAGFVARVVCRNIKLPFEANEADGLSTNEVRLLLALNTHKMRALDATLKLFAARGHKTLVFCDDLFCLEWAYTTMLACGHEIVAKLNMHTDEATRCSAIAAFDAAPRRATLFMSRTGDEALDVPSASAIVMFWNGWASRRQLVQRIGRISRPFGVPAESVLLYSDDPREIATVEHRNEYLLANEYEIEHTEIAANGELARLYKESMPPRAFGPLDARHACMPPAPPPPAQKRVRSKKRGLVARLNRDMRRRTVM